MTPKRRKYLEHISWAERIGRHCLDLCKEKIKREKRYLNEHKVRPFGKGFDVAKCKKTIKDCKKTLAVIKRSLKPEFTSNEK